MRFLIVGDLHGKIPKVSVDEFDAIIAPGDFCSDGSKYYQFKALQQRLHGKNVTWQELAGKKRAKLMQKKSFRDGRKILQRLNKYGVPVFVVPGNWDQEEEWDKLTKGLRFIIDVHQQLIHTPELAIIGHGFSHGPEFPPNAKEAKRYTQSELRLMKRDYTQLLAEYSKLMRKAKKPLLLLSHNVPYNTSIDKIVNKDSPRNGQHFGSLIARDLILKHKPLLCIGGHMHEHFTSCKLGRTTCINAGFGPDVNILLDVQKGKIVQLTFLEKGKKR